MFEFLNALVRSRGMPTDYEVYAVEAVGKRPNSNKVKVTGDKPIGTRFDGRFIWPIGKKQGANPKSVIITIEEYRAANLEWLKQRAASVAQAVAA